MKKYTIDVTSASVSSPSQVTVLRRNTQTTKGVLLNSTHIEVADWSSRTFPNNYNDPALYITGRSVPLIPESTSSNTLITNDGLVAVFYQLPTGTYYMSLFDLFDTGTVVYNDITPQDYSALVSYLTSNNPEHKSIFIVYKNAPGAAENFRTKNVAIYSDGEGSTYFASDMDTGLETDQYGHHKVSSSSFQEDTDEFTFLKKQFFVVEGPSVTASIDNFGSTLTAVLESGNKKAYWFKDTGITGENDLLALKFRSSAADYGTIKVY
jgi:hypothetical protein